MTLMQARALQDIPGMGDAIGRAIRPGPCDTCGLESFGHGPDSLAAGFPAHKFDNNR